MLDLLTAVTWIERISIHIVLGFSCGFFIRNAPVRLTAVYSSAWLLYIVHNIATPTGYSWNIVAPGVAFLTIFICWLLLAARLKHE